ncbi:MAG: CoA transferase [Chloroflexi bacterium]|nr:CoA transferase [Chloroflexota bacterium]
MPGPLTGLTALEIGDRGEVAGKLLADAGVELIRVEPPAGARTRHTGPFVDDRPDPDASLRFAYLNTNKRGVTLNLAESADAARWRALVARADIVVDSTDPGALDALSLGHDALAGDSPSLVWCAITPFGLTGPRRDWTTTDLVSMALGGPPMSTGYDDHDLPPIRADGEHSFWMAGEYAVAGIVAALLQRTLTGQGQLIDVSIHEAVACTTEGAFESWEYRQRINQRQTGRHSAPDPTPPSQFLSGDGHYMQILGGGVPRRKHLYPLLLEWLDEHDAAQDLHDPAYSRALYDGEGDAAAANRHVGEVIRDFVATQPAEALYRRGQSMHLPWGIVRWPEENLDDPHWEDREFFVEGPVPGSPDPARYPRAGYRFTTTPVEFRRPAPRLGEHNAEVFGEFETG